MSLALIGRKVGMTRVFTEDGTSIPVTVLEVLPNRVTQIKTIASDG
jgi:large subunit ribosomal protein L3